MAASQFPTHMHQKCTRSIDIVCRRLPYHTLTLAAHQVSSLKALAHAADLITRASALVSIACTRQCSQPPHIWTYTSLGARFRHVVFVENPHDTLHMHFRKPHLHTPYSATRHQGEVEVRKG